MLRRAAGKPAEQQPTMLSSGLALSTADAGW
jgi:hypothetical protein